MPNKVDGLKLIITAAVMEFERKAKGMTRVEYALVSLWQAHKATQLQIAQLQMLIAPSPGAHAALERFIKGRGGASPLPRQKP